MSYNASTVLWHHFLNAIVRSEDALFHVLATMAEVFALALPLNVTMALRYG